MSCVNTNSREFKDTVTRLNVSSSSLEVIVHDIQNSIGNEDYFPTDAEILEKLRGTSFKATEDQAKLYELKGLDKPMEFGNANSAMNKVAELSQWFPKEAIHCYQNAGGVYEVHVASPHSHTDSIQGEFIEGTDYSKEPIEVGTQDLYFDQNISGENNGLIVKEVKDDKVTFVRTKWVDTGGILRDRVEVPQSKQTITEDKFRAMTGMSGREFSFTTEYGIANVSPRAKTTEDGHKLYSLEISISDGNRGKGYGTAMYEAVIDRLAKEDAYLTPGNVVSSNHIWESLYKKGRVVKTKTQSGEEVYVALSKSTVQNTKPTQNVEENKQSTKPKTIEYTPIGKARQTYTIEGSKIFNKNGVEVFASDSADRRKIYANLAVQEGRAVVVDYNNMKYVVNNKGKILSVATGNFVWENTPENGNRKAILEIAKQKFNSKQLPTPPLSQEEINIYAETSEELSSTELETPIQETTNQEQQPIKKENQSYVERAVSTTQQIDNLNNSTALSATEVRHVAEQAVYWISDHITELQETPGLAEKIYGEQFKDKDFAAMSRADVVRTIGPDAMIAMCREKFSPENTDYEDFDTIEKAEIIIDNWGAIMMLASDVFTSMEDFSIVSSKDGNISEVNEDTFADADNLDASNMEADVLENEGDLQEHWQVETKTLDVLTTMSQMVKQALTKCYLLDSEGNKITSEFGINERVNAREATNSILRWTQGALTLEQLITKLQEKAESNPWVTQIIDRLSDKSGKESDFQGQFFGTFCKHFQPYSVVIEKDGRYISVPVNEEPALKQAVDSIEVQAKVGEHPLFGLNGINKEALEDLKARYREVNGYLKPSYDLNNPEVKKEIAHTLGYVSNLLGYYITPDMVEANLTKETLKTMESALMHIRDTLNANKDDSMYNPFDFEKGIKGNLKAFLRPITEHLEDIAVSAFYDSGKMYQSYITPSYTSKLFQKFSQTGKAFDDFIMAEYGNIPWFHTGNNIERGWRNAWLKALATDSKAREIFKHKVQLNFNKHNYMRNMSDMEYALSLFTEYFNEKASEKQSRVPAWFRVPMLSNKPSSEFIRFYSERGANYKETLTNGFKMIFDQELSRIQTVEMRNLDKKDPRFIKNFDTNGKKFMFLDFMNEYLTGDKKSSELGKLIREKLDGKEIDEAKLNTLAKEAIMNTMEARANAIVNEWESQGILKGAEKIANIGTTKEEIRENLKNFVWNDTFAAINIMQLTITDIAYYKDAEDLQKRLAQIHAPGIRGNVAATDYEGKPVTDGKFRTIKLTDFDSFVSNIIDNVSVVFDRRIANAPEAEKAALRALKESLVGEDGAFRQINVADAQGYSSPTSYRKKAFVFGKWSRHAEEIYQKLKKGTYTYNDLQVAFQPLKPFVYSQITKDAGIEGAPLSTMKNPVQYKNSEYLLILADAMLQGENTGKPNLLRAIFEVMEESHYKDGKYKTDGIDTVQFESTVKSGLMGKINLNDLVNEPLGESVAKARLEAAIYDSTGTYNNSSVDAVPFEDYCLQQEVPAHFKEHEQAHGSQLRYIIVSELENFNYLGEPVTYNIEGRQVTAQEFKAEYENTIGENIQESINELAEELFLDDLSSLKDRNIALSKILQREILSSPRYGVDLLQACSVDENGRFRIPLGDPIQSKRVEQLINSIIKNRVNKQKIAGGPVVQVSNFGTSKELNIRFKDKSGNLLMTRAEFEGTDTEYKNYIKENQAGIAYFEVFAPIYSNQLFTQFADKNGVVSIQALEMLDPDLLKMIGYRI